MDLAQFHEIFSFVPRSRTDLGLIDKEKSTWYGLCLVLKLFFRIVFEPDEIWFVFFEQRVQEGKLV